MATNQYIGARYVPLFAEPIEWDKTQQYEPLTIVTNNGNSYTSRQFVPTGIDISNESFWALTANYNAQVEQYRKEVAAYDDRITTAQNTADSAKTASDAATTAVAAEKSRAEKSESEIKSLAETNETDIATLDEQVAGTQDSGLKTLVSGEVARATKKESELGVRIDSNDNSIESLDKQMAGTSSSGLLTKINNLSSKFPIITSSINDGAVTAPKMAQSAITSILQGLTIHRFDSSDSSADNGGLVVPSSNTVLAGLYIEELTLLVITRCGGSDSWPSTSNTIKLPDYVPSVTSNVNCGDFTYMVWSSSSNFIDWSSMILYPNGYLRPKNNFTGSHVLPGCVIVYLRPYMSDTVSTNATYSDLVTQNGVI